MGPSVSLEEDTVSSLEDSGSAVNALDRETGAVRKAAVEIDRMLRMATTAHFIRIMGLIKRRSVDLVCR
jgi:hypothetical protein